MQPIVKPTLTQPPVSSRIKLKNRKLVFYGELILGNDNMGDRGAKGVGCIVNPPNWDWIDEELKDTNSLRIQITRISTGDLVVEFEDMEEI